MKEIRETMQEMAREMEKVRVRSVVLLVADRSFIFIILVGLSG